MERIRPLFKPFQPSIAHQGPGSVSYEEIDPGNQLREWIFCFWRLKSDQKLKEDFMYRVVSDGCIDVLLELHDPEKVFITGFSNRYTEYGLGRQFDYVGMRFFPGAFPAIFGISAERLIDKFLRLEEILPDFAHRFRAFPKQQLELSDIGKVFQDLMQPEIQDPIQVDPRFTEAMVQILESKGPLDIKDLDPGVSERQLRRLFKFYFGESPKTFVRIKRFQKVLGRNPTPESLKEEKSYFDEGYYDQAHFIKEFRDFYGVTPKQAFG